MKIFASIVVSGLWMAGLLILLQVFFPAFLAAEIKTLPLILLFLAGWLGSFIGIQFPPYITVDSLLELIGISVLCGAFIVGLIYLAGWIFSFAVTASFQLWLFFTLLVALTAVLETAHTWILALNETNFL